MKKQTAQWWVLLLLIVAAPLCVELTTEAHPVFSPEKLHFFYAWFGFLACLVMVVVIRTVGIFLRRKDGYYKEVRHDE